MTETKGGWGKKKMRKRFRSTFGSFVNCPPLKGGGGSGGGVSGILHSSERRRDLEGGEEW